MGRQNVKVICATCDRKETINSARKGVIFPIKFSCGHVHYYRSQGHAKGWVLLPDRVYFPIYK